MHLPHWAPLASPQQYPTPWLFVTHKSSPPLGIPCLFPSTLSMPCTRSNTSSDLWLQYYSTTALAPLQPLFHSHSRRPQAQNPRLQYHQLLPLSASMCRQAEPSHSHHNQPQGQTLAASPPALALVPPPSPPAPLTASDYEVKPWLQHVQLLPPPVLLHLHLVAGCSHTDARQCTTRRAVKSVATAPHPSSPIATNHPVPTTPAAA